MWPKDDSGQINLKLCLRKYFKISSRLRLHVYIYAESILCVGEPLDQFASNFKPGSSEEPREYSCSLV